MKSTNNFYLPYLERNKKSLKKIHLQNNNKLILVNDIFTFIH